MDKTKARVLKQKLVRFCILDGKLYWKDSGGVFLNYVVEDEAKQIMEDFHKGDYGGHHYWKPTMNKILGACFY